MLRSSILCLSAALMLLSLPSCLYRSPNDGEVSTMPTTNNPQINKGTNPGDIIPGIRY